MDFESEDGCCMSERDIDRIIGMVTRAMPDVQVVQIETKYPADDDGVWKFRLPGIEKDIQIESSTGTCPFVVESDELSSYDARRGITVDDVAKMVLDYLRSASNRPGSGSKGTG